MCVCVRAHVRWGGEVGAVWGHGHHQGLAIDIASDGSNRKDSGRGMGPELGYR